MSFSRRFPAEATEIISPLDESAIQRIIKLLADTRDAGGRLFIPKRVGLEAPPRRSHAMNDFRKMTGIEAYAPTGQRLRADGAHQQRRLEQRLAPRQPPRRQRCSAVFLGGENLEKGGSTNLVAALQFARVVGDIKLVETKWESVR